MLLSCSARMRKNGKKMLGSSSVIIHPEMETAEIRETLQRAYHAAALVNNEYYELNAGKERNLSGQTVSLQGRVSRRAPARSWRHCMKLTILRRYLSILRKYLQSALSAGS